MAEQNLTYDLSRCHLPLSGTLPRPSSVGFIKDDVEHRVKFAVNLKNGPQMSYYCEASSPTLQTFTESMIVTDKSYIQRKDAYGPKWCYNGLLQTNSSNVEDLVDVHVVLHSSILPWKNLPEEVIEELRMVKLLPASWFASTTPTPTPTPTPTSVCSLM